MIRGQPKVVKHQQIDKFKDNYAEANLNYIKNKWQNPSQLKSKKTFRRKASPRFTLPEGAYQSESDPDDDFQSLFAKN